MKLISEREAATNTSGKVANILLAFCLFLPTTFVEIKAYPLLLLYSIFALLTQSVSIRKNYLLLFLYFIFLAVQSCFYIYHLSLRGYEDLTFGNPIIGSAFALVMLVLATRVNVQVLIYFGCFIVIEIFIAVLEYLLGQPYIFVGQLRSADLSLGPISTFDKHSFDFYNNSVYGLGSTSSSLSFKIVFYLLLSRIVGLKLSRVFILLLVLGAVLSFSRMAIFCLLIYWGLYMLLEKKNKVYWVVVVLLGALAISQSGDLFFKGSSISLDVLSSEKILNAITSSRYSIWQAYWEYFPENPILGYYGETKFFDVGYAITSNPHNTYIYILFKQGVVGLLLYFLMLFFGVEKNVRYCLLPLLLYSLTSVNFGFYFSIYDIFIIYLAFVYKEDGHADYCKR